VGCAVRNSAVLAATLKVANEGWLCNPVGRSTHEITSGASPETAHLPTFYKALQSVPKNHAAQQKAINLNI